MIAERRLVGTPAEAAPFWFRGQQHSAVKRFWHGTQRVIAPAETLERVRPHFRRLGLTRLANVTGLDRIGIPTILSIRPNSSFLSVDAGKGFTVEAAMASAAMECVERYHGENAVASEFRASYEEVAETRPTIPFDLLPLARDAHFAPRQPLEWTTGWDLIAQREVAVPVPLVRLQQRHLHGRGLTPFQTGSNGLAAGNNLLEALSGALLECVERDAVACHRIASERGGGPIPRVRLDTIVDPQVRDLLRRFERAEVGVVLFDCAVDTLVPVYMAYLYDRVSRHIGIYRGYGAHLDPAIAMIRALTEAVQARVIFVAGSRDDFFRHNYLSMKQGDDVSAIRDLERIPATVDGRHCRSSATATFQGDLQILLDRLRQIGISQVIVFELTEAPFTVAAVRVIVPGLEGYMFDYYAPGSRARAFTELRKAEVTKL
jgi:YcaO-like protein with predicted kinase domain